MDGIEALMAMRDGHVVKTYDTICSEYKFYEYGYESYDPDEAGEGPVIWVRWEGSKYWDHSYAYAQEFISTDKQFEIGDIDEAYRLERRASELRAMPSEILPSM